MYLLFEWYGNFFNVLKFTNFLLLQCVGIPSFLILFQHGMHILSCNDEVKYQTLSNKNTENDIFE